MKKVRVDLGDRSYNVTIGDGAISAVGEAVSSACRGRKGMIVSNPVVASHYAERLRSSLSSAGFGVDIVTVPAGEEYKTLDTIRTIYTSFLDARLDRTSVVFALGGGVVGDMAGFAAATFLRGIDFVQVPTTLLAQVDASVGGKTGVDLPEGKNLVGAFHQPKSVIIDIGTLRTLPPRELRAGLAEVIKHGIITDLPYFEFLEANAGRLLALDMIVMEPAVTRSVEIKADVVSRDERETTSLRKTLNYGHTFAHAIEVVTGYGKYLHGEAVAIGMVAAAEVAEMMGIAEPGTHERITGAVRSLELPAAPGESLDSEAVMRSLYLDKKVAAGRINFVLPKRIGEVIVTDDVPVRVVEEVIGRWA